MAQLSRRDFLRTTAATVGLGAAASGGLAGCAAPVKGNLAPKSGRRVIVVGGGWGGATAAKYIRLQDPSIEVVLLEPNRTFVSCPFSNLVLSGVETLDALTLRYDGLRAHGVKIRHEAATALEPDTKRVRIGEGYLEYDRLVVAPGVDFLWSQVDGVAGQEASVLHAWKAGPQTVELARRLQALPDGGVVVMTVPRRPVPLPPGPLRARLPDRLVPQDQEAPGQAHRPRRQQRRHLQGRPLQGRLPRLSRTSTTAPPTSSSASTSALARSSRPSASACATTS